MAGTEVEFGDDFKVTQEMKDAFNQYGYVIVRNVLSKEEVNKLFEVFDVSDLVKNHMDVYSDGDKHMCRKTMWNQPGNDVTGMLARCEKVAGTCEELIGGEVYHYHSKLMMKQPKIGGKHQWHQDYGYWYYNTALRPNLMTVFMALDRCHKGNGCLQILEGSHLCGRIDHTRVGDQMGADMDRVKMIQEICPLKYVELNPGDAVYFHCNILHCSAVNTSLDRRWAILCAYNRADNNPVEKHHHPFYTPLNKVPNTAIMDCTTMWDSTGKDPFTVDKRLESNFGYIKREL
ncbi:L-proline trans-4-hydroxylase [Patella vulgata]|uniref:L-proline trans-4-hydroxylase n=1 Tax=Patella vulgata TaxID=6465 RepID=UPI00217F5E35|nr:L-proline trans-4-hydroxylase [Patella vulgata]